jgi:acetoin utilization deacetylase AcuC-like enzyme
MNGFCSSPRFVEHVTGSAHPERPDRLRAVHRAVREAGLVTSPDPFADFQIDLGPLPKAHKPLVELSEPQPATVEQLLMVHSAAHVEHVRRVCEAGGGVLDQGDTPVGSSSYEIARLSCGAVLKCCDAVMSGQVRRTFAAVRPPGHHAEPDRAMGFCLFSNIAIAARHLQRAHGIGRIAIVDFDVHHGNGTQACFEDDPSVLFVSIHQHPRTCYPGTGYEHEAGSAGGHAFTLNIPMRPGRDDDDYLHAFDERIIPAIDAFRPEVLLISAGFDGHRDDPLAQMELSESGFEQMTRKLVDAAKIHCDGRVISALEGGYDLRALGRSVVRHLIAMM